MRQDIRKYTKYKWYDLTNFNRSKTSYSYENWSKLNDEYEWSEEFQEQLREFQKEFVEKLKLSNFEAIKIIKKFSLNEMSN